MRAHLRQGKCRRGLAGLRFELDGEDMTGAESKLTQAAMDQLLACQLLTRVVFHSQSDVAGLLEVRSLAHCDFRSSPYPYKPAAD